MCMLFRILSFSDTPLGVSDWCYVSHVCRHSLMMFMMMVMMMVMVMVMVTLYIEAVITLLLFTMG